MKSSNGYQSILGHNSNTFIYSKIFTSMKQRSRIKNSYLDSETLGFWTFSIVRNST
jgi:hypothetical protein